MITVATLLWQWNDNSFPFSRAYDEEWAIRLYCGFQRNLTRPFRFVCFADKPYDFQGYPIEIERIKAEKPDYSTCIEPYRLNEAMILVGLDTLVVGNIDHLASHCEVLDRIAIPRDPYFPHKQCNGVALVPAGQRRIYDEHRGQNDMDWLNAQPHYVLDTLWPGAVVSYKGTVRDRGLGDARIVYFHGVPKFTQMPDDPLIKSHWRR